MVLRDTSKKHFYWSLSTPHEILVEVTVYMISSTFKMIQELRMKSLFSDLKHSMGSPQISRFSLQTKVLKKT